MIYYIFYEWLYKTLSATGGGESYFVKALNVFQYVTFRTAYAAVTALLISLVFGRRVIDALQRLKVGQEIREEGPQSHKAKRGTPTMGGVAIMVAIWVGYLVSHGLTGEPITASALLVLFLTTALGIVGFLDDFIKLRRQRNLGLNKTSKLVGQLLTALIFGVLGVRFINAEGLSPA